MKTAIILARAELLSRPSPRSTPDEWATLNRTYGPHTGHPGPRDPSLTPYMLPFSRAVASRRYRKVVMACAAQSGKSESLLDLIGQRLDQQPSPILYVGPSKQFVSERFEPRVMELLDQAPTLAAKVAREKKMSKTRKSIAGVQLVLGHAGSSAALKSDPFSLALTDEADELLQNVKHQGDPIGLIDRRGDTYADFCHAIVSTPSAGIAETETDADSGLVFWRSDADADSKIWDLFQQGTRHHWAWPCPQCSDYFIPRFSCLEIPNGVTPSIVLTDAHLLCPHCGGVITEDDKAEMNRRGLYVAPGQTIVDGKVIGDPPDSTTASFWASGLCSPFRSFGQRAAEFVEAKLSGDEHRTQVVMNASFGELWGGIAGDAPEWNEVEKLKLATYSSGNIPAQVVFLTAGVDVQKSRLVYAIRGWGARQESWLIEAGELWGETHHEDVWTDLSELLERTFEGGLTIRRCFVDAGFRPGKKDMVPEHKVYDFCRRNSRLVFASKGFDHRDQPLSVKRIDVNLKGAASKYGLDLVRLDTDFLKSWVHQRLRWPEDQPGGWHLPNDVTESYCKQIVSESRVRKSGGGYAWIQRSRENHFLDCESLAYAAAYMLGVSRMTSERAEGLLSQRERNSLRSGGKPVQPGQKQEIKFAPDYDQMAYDAHWNGN